MKEQTNMQEKEFDLFMNMMRNPSASFDTLVAGGLTINNTSLQDKSVYENSDKVKEQFKDQYGEFDQQAFDSFYNNAKAYYNSLSSANYEESMAKQATFHRDNIFAPVDQRRQGPDFFEIQMANPYQTTSSVVELGKVGARTKSVDELAQSNKVLLNPTTAGPNLENAQWGDSPNDNFWGYFTDTLVQAQYDEDGTHIDPFTGKEVEHKAGELKLDNSGNFYYEKLDGRDIYGRRILNKMNVLTTDGSFWNKYDFFDSDDLNQKSIGGTVLKNLALVGTMFIPYVGPWIAGLSIATQLAGLGATLGKMATGSDNPTLSAIEGWSKSVGRQGATSEYAQEHTWCWENFINLIGDVAAQLKEQRFIFEKIPYAFKGANMMTAEGQAAKLAQLKETQLKLAETKIDQLRRSGTTSSELLRAEAELKTAAALRAQAELDSFIKGYNKIGEVLSKGYMTAVTVGDTYGEAKLAGASDLDATLLTLGYAAGEYAILNTGLGEWILPELRASRYRQQAIARALTSIEDETKQGALQTARQQFASLTTKEGKKEYVKKLFNIGKNLAKDVYTAEKATGAKTLSATFASAMGEGTEEVSEELLADFSKGCYDVVKWLQGEETRLNTFGYDFEKGQWNSSEVIDRYGMSLVGGFIGGGLTNLGTNYKTFHNLDKISNQSAIQELVYMARNGGLNDFMKQVNKMQLGDPNMSTDYDIIDGTPVFAPGTAQNNQDLAIKTVIQNQVNMIQSILSANGAVSDSQFLDAQTLGDLRFAALHKSTTAGLYLQTYNSLLADIVRLTNSVEEVINSGLDSNQDGTVTDREQRKNKLSDDKKAAVKKIEAEIKDKKRQLQDIIEGKSALDFVSTALFETTSALSGLLRVPTTFPLFVEMKYGKKYSEITEDEKASAMEEYEKWKATEGRDRIHDMARIYRTVAEQSSQVIKQHEQTYLQTSEELHQLDQTISGIYRDMQAPDEAWLELAQDVSDSSIVTLSSRLINVLGTEEDAQALREILERRNSIDEQATAEERKQQVDQIAIDYKNKLEEVLLQNITQFVQPFIERGFANQETKNQLSRILLAVQNLAKKKAVEWDIQAEENYDPFNMTEEINPYAATLTDLASTIQQVSNLNSTPLEQNLDEFSISIGAEPIKLTQLIQRLNLSFNDSSESITKFNMDQELYRDLANAVYTMELYKAAILGARTDAASLNNIFGYNATLNEVASKQEGAEHVELAEIDSQTADLFVQDIDTNLNKLQFLKRLYEINQGQKLSRQDRVSTRKDLLIYKRLKHIVSILDDDKLKDWEGFLDLQTAINGMTIHEQLLASNGTTVSEDNREAFELEKLAAENAIYDFFQIESNKQKLNDPAKLAELINPRKLQLYTEATELLNEGLENLDDNSIVWWLASRAALRSQDFYYQYRQIIEPDAEKPLAPISTQELAIYNNYASIVNGNIFTAFYNAYRQSVIEDWKNKTVEERKTVWKRLGKTDQVADSLSRDELADYVLNMGFTPRYSNIVLTEGIPGSGKSTGVFQSTLKLLNKYHKELLSNVAVVHGANPDSATKLRDDIGLTKDNSKVYGRESWMKEISATWRDYPRSEVDDSYLIPKSDYTVTDENEIRSSLKIKETSTPPSLIIIDEISKFSAYDLDQIDKFAQKYGITVLVAGDFDQSGVVATHTVDLGNLKNQPWEASLNRTSFIRSPKLGVSMRTDNSVKTANLQKLQAYMQNPTGKIDFNYYQDETGIFGDKVHLYTDENNATDTQSILDEVLADVNAMIATLKEGERIGYIYNSKSSPIYKALSQDQYRPYIDFREGGSAQGLEGQYYVIEADPHVPKSEYLRDIYTGMSRAQQGSLIIAPTNVEGVAFNGVPVNEKVSEELSTNVVATFAKKRRDLLDKVAAEGTVSNIIPRTANVSIPSTKPQQGLEQAIDPTPPPTPEPPAQPVQAPATPSEPTAIEEMAKDIREKAGINTDVARRTTQNSDNLFIGGLELDNLPESARYVDSHGLAKGNEIENLLNLLINGVDPNRRFDTAPLGRGEQGDGAAIGTASGTSYRGGLFIIAAEPSESFGENYNTIPKTGIKTVLINTGDPEIPECLEIATKLKEQLSERFPDIDFVLYTEAADYYKNKQTAKPEAKPAEQPQVEPLVYEDNAAPITQTEIINDEQYQSKVDQSSENPDIAQSTVTQSADAITIDMLLHTFNTFESGVLVGEDGKPLPIGSQEWMDARIDSVNGLVKVDRALGKPERTVAEYIRLIGRLRSILFNTDDKSKICERLQNALGLQGIYCTFALKSSPRLDRSDPNRLTDGYLGKPSRFGKSINEETLYNGSSDTRSHEWHPKSIVAIIGSKENGDLLELPLIALSSPFTLIQTKDENGANAFGQMFNRFQQLLSQGTDLHSISTTLVKEFDGISQYKELVDLFKLYNFTDGAVFYINDQQWTPSKDLQLIGPQFVTDAGYYQEVPGLSMNDTTNPEAEWLSIAEYAQNPQVYVTKQIYISLDGRADDIDNQIVNAGHPFVLVSFNTDLNTDKKVIDQYLLQQKDPSVKKQVKLMYILPPKATISDYLNNLHKILTKQSGVDPIGNLFTSYKLLKVLLQDNRFRTLMEQKSKGLLQKIEQAVQQLDTLTPTEQKDLLYQVQDWGDQNFKLTKLAGLFDGTLSNLVFNRNTVSKAVGQSTEVIYTPDTEAFSLIEEILGKAGINGIYYHVKLPKDAQKLGPFHVPVQDKGYTIGGKPAKIHGKLDSYTFKGHMAGLVESALGKLRPQRDGVHMYSIDSSAYLKGSSNLAQPEIRNRQESETERAIKNVAAYVNRKLGIDVSAEYTGKSIADANRKVVEQINFSDNGAVAFTIGQELRISDVNPYLQGGQVYIYDQNLNPVTDLSSLADNTGKYQFRLFTVKGDETIQYEATYDYRNNELIINQEIEQREQPSMLSVTPENFSEYLQAGNIILGPTFKWDPPLADVFGLLSYDEFIEALNTLDHAEREEDLEALLDEATDPLQKQVITDLLNLERSHDPSKQDVNDEQQICPRNIKIKF